MFRGTWNFITGLKNALGNLLFLAILIFVLFVVLTSEKVSVPDTAALVIDPGGIIVEQKRALDPVNQFLSGYDEQEAETLLRDILQAIESAQDDKRIKALVLDLEDLQGAPMSKLQEIGAALETFKQSEKPVYAFGPRYTQSQYYIASFADKVYLNEQSFQSFGGVFLTGLGVYPTHIKSAMDKLKINFHVFKVGTYKGAVEPYTRDNMSEESREANQQWLGTLWQEYVDTITTNRDVTAQAFEKYTNEYDVLLGEADNDPAKLAVDQGLVDAQIDRGAWINEMRGLVGKSKRPESGFNQIGFRDYLSVTNPPIPDISPASNKIAVITAKGTILDGEQPAGDIGADTVSRLIQLARDDNRVKALVMRIDSPGGSAAASEQIRAELEMTQKAGKPVVVSMSSYAASGGYWIAASANKIFAQTTTVTGSIGTFLLFPTLDESLAELGIYTDGVGTTELSGALDLTQPLNPVLQRTLERTIQHTYSKFIDLVAQGREMNPDDVDKIAQGRVWAGHTALEIGLVDAVGDLQDAIDSAALLADVDQYEVSHLEKQLSTRERLLQQVLGGSLKAIHSATGGVSRHWMDLGRLSSEVSDFVRMSKEPGLYLQCIQCRTR